MEFSVTFMDNSRITGRAIKVIHNGVDVTNNTRDEMMKCFIEGKDTMELITDNYSIEFPIDTVLGFTI